jgi:rhodanese-related sulfurtransferase
MKNWPSLRILVALVAVLALFAAACGDDDSSGTTTTAAAATTQVTEAPTTTVEVFDVNAAVAAYAATIPEGFNAVGDITAFKDAVAASDALLIDVREPGEYVEGHLPGAINIPLRTLADNLDKVPTDRQVFIYCKSGHRAGMGLSSLGMLGYDNVSAFPPGYAGWTDAGEEVTTDEPTAEIYTIPEIPAEMLVAVGGFLSTIPEGWLSAGDVSSVKEAMGAGAQMLDVRTADEYAVGHIPEAISIPLRELGVRFDEVPTDSQVISYCKSGHRQAMSVPIIHILGNSGAKGFPGSYNSWTAANEPVDSA